MISVGYRECVENYKKLMFPQKALRSHEDWKSVQCFAISNTIRIERGLLKRYALYRGTLATIFLEF